MQVVSAKSKGKAIARDIVYDKDLQRRRLMLIEELK